MSKRDYDMQLTQACATTALVLKSSARVKAAIIEFKPEGWAQAKFGAVDIPLAERPAFLEKLRLLRQTVGDPVAEYDKALERFLHAAMELKQAYDHTRRALTAAPEISWDTAKEFSTEPKRKLPRILGQVSRLLYSTYDNGEGLLETAAKLARADAADEAARCAEESMWRSACPADDGEDW